MKKLDKFLDGIRDKIEEITSEYIGKHLTIKLEEEITERLKDFADEVIFFDNYGNSNYNCSTEEFLNGKKLVIERPGYIVCESQNLIYWSSLDYIYVDIFCRVLDK